MRNGSCSIFAFVKPFGRKRHVSVHEHRRAADWAMEIKYLSDVMSPNSEKIILVMGNLNTHNPASLYKAFAPSKARRIIKRLEIHYTPKHGRWINMAEIKLNVMTHQCLSRCTKTIELLTTELTAWEEKRNKTEVKSDGASRQKTPVKN